MIELFKKLLIKKLAKKMNNKKNWAKIWQEKTQCEWNLKQILQTKKLQLK
jgi:hypothetical protein